MTTTQEKRRVRSDIRPTAVQMQLEHVAREGEFELLIVADDEGYLVGWSVDESRYDELGTRIKCNPAIKTVADREGLIAALNEGRIDIIATDHAPHTLEEKSNTYFKAPAGLPLVQHALQTMFDLAAAGTISLELLVDRTSHAPADIFGVADRGYVREGYFADLVIVDTDKPYRVDRAGELCKCHWSPFEGHEFTSTIDTTIINGNVVFRDGELTGAIAGQRLEFTRSR